MILLPGGVAITRAVWSKPGRRRIHSTHPEFTLGHRSSKQLPPSVALYWNEWTVVCLSRGPSDISMRADGVSSESYRYLFSRWLLLWYTLFYPPLIIRLTSSWYRSILKGELTQKTRGLLNLRPALSLVAQQHYFQEYSSHIHCCVVR